MKLSTKFTPRASRHSSFARSMPPNSIRARRIASSRSTPLRTKSSAYASRWKRSSASISLSIRERRSIARNHERTRLRTLILRPACFAGFPSFVPQRHHRIDPRRAAGREVRCRECDQDEQRQRPKKTQRVGIRHAEQHPLDQRCRPKRQH